jgi:hypothetical protein
MGGASSSADSHKLTLIFYKLVILTLLITAPIFYIT